MLVDCNDSDSVCSPSQTGPVTYGQTKLLRTLKANLIVNECFETSVDTTIVGPYIYTLKTLIADYFLAPEGILHQVLCS